MVMQINHTGLASMGVSGWSAKREDSATLGEPVSTGSRSNIATDLVGALIRILQTARHSESRVADGSLGLDASGLCG